MVLNSFVLSGLGARILSQNTQFQNRDLGQNIGKMHRPIRGETDDGAVEGKRGAAAVAPCGSPDCAGCYDVGDGRKIHPPRCGEEWL